MIRLNQGAEPQILVENGEAWTAEYVKWCENPVGMTPRRYAHPEIRSALEAVKGGGKTYHWGGAKLYHRGDA